MLGSREGSAGRGRGRALALVGPVVRGEEGDWELVGVVSRDGNFDEDPMCVVPMVSTDSVAHADWITSTVAGGGQGPAL